MLLDEIITLDDLVFIDKPVSIYITIYLIS